jgi:HK97 family phage major capsid protein
MSKYDEFKARFPGWIDPEKEAELRFFIESVFDLSDDYEKILSRLRATGKFKSLFGGLHAGARHSNTMMTNTTPVLSEKERREYGRDFYKTILSMAKDRRRPSGMAAAMSDYLGNRNPDLRSNDATTLLVPLEALISRKALQVTSAPAGGFLVANDLATSIEFMLRSASVCVRAGARVLPGLRGDLSLGRETQEVTCEWLHELEELAV